MIHKKSGDAYHRPHDGPCRTGVGENRSDYGADLPACNERHFRLSYSCRNIYACGGKRDEGAVFEGDGKDEYPGHLWNVPRGILRDSAPYVPHVRQQYFKRGREKAADARAGQPLCQRPGGRGSRGKSGARNQHCEEQSDPAGTLLFRLYAAGKVPRNL